VDYTIDYIENICTEDIYEQLKELLFRVDDEFVPSLSSREGTTQKYLHSGNKKNEIKSYYQEMRIQHNIVCTSNNKLLGFISFISNHEIDILENYTPCNYLSTIAVDPNYRGRKIASKLYQFFIDKSTIIFKANYLVTRTWSTNKEHINLLHKLGFKLAKIVPNARGEGIDTIYFSLDLSINRQQNTQI